MTTLPTFPWPLPVDARPRPQAHPETPRRKLRALFISDLHLGSRGCQVDRILDFLARHEAQTIYLVGDIFDNWHPIFHHWSDEHDRVVQEILGRAREGVRLVYLPGNHDEVFRRHFGTYFGCLEVVDRVVHEAADGHRYLVLHGDQYDASYLRARWLNRLGTRVDTALRAMDAGLNALRRTLGLSEGRVIEALIDWGNSAMHFGNDFERRLTAAARDAGLDGVICGHFHKAALHERDGLTYGNCGDWMDSFTALGEDFSGTLRLIEAPAPLPARRPDLGGTMPGAEAPAMG
ncbi:UDP-2,3-diacylglucosamine diphosphatase [Phaeovulum vinaykumarii]|uniref:UDP-2,3-diacylglucosamine pyrophosphatase LpxH n=1 Tax=Phaeovulum vinaykumarii TaxID=407234 RepID=A0A1N7JZ79_9RHOB|nr:UDP-2,3-diacylglucosamine diphosphatase [Phaeovulum vinaykumarii]SIS54628.1 UDP-2,3-diacylglucosamine pyrophosphatase LpxH [Phaeovulum vinaykumarii]SOB92008.1 UDP-2,3-diacylglucosamine pyrophosphatase LpxH [Phaeovulum vinaykumarii]